MQQTTNSAPQRTADSRHALSTDGNAPAINYGAVIPGLDWLFCWLDRHPRTSSALLWLMSAALAWAVWSYEFTIPAYK